MPTTERRDDDDFYDDVLHDLVVNLLDHYSDPTADVHHYYVDFDADDVDQYLYNSAIGFVLNHPGFAHYVDLTIYFDPAAGGGCAGADL
jgi:hypothetical protein